MAEGWVGGSVSAISGISGQVSVLLIILFLVFRVIFLVTLVLIPGLDTGDHRVPPGPGRDLVHGAVPLTSEPDSIQLYDQVVWQKTILTVLVQLVIRCEA